MTLATYTTEKPIHETKIILPKLWKEMKEKSWNSLIFIKNSQSTMRYDDAKDFIVSFSKVPFHSLKGQTIDLSSFILLFICQFDYAERFPLSINLCFHGNETASIVIKADIQYSINVDVLKTFISVLVAAQYSSCGIILKEEPRDINQCSIMRIVVGCEELFVAFDEEISALSLIGTRNVTESFYEMDFMFKCDNFSTILIDLMNTCIISTLYHPNIELTLGLFQESLLLRIPFCKNPLNWFDTLHFRTRLFANFLFPGLYPVFGIQRYEIPELFGCADACVVSSPAIQSNRLYLYVFQNGYPLKGLTNFTIGILNSLHLPISILPLPFNDYDEEKNIEKQIYVIDEKYQQIQEELQKKKRTKKDLYPQPPQSLLLKNVPSKGLDDFCIQCRVPKLKNTSLIITVNSTRTDIVGFSAKAIELAFNKCLEQRPNLRNSFEEISSANGIWKTMQSVQDSMIAVLGKEIVGHTVWNKCAKIVNQKIKYDY